MIAADLLEAIWMSVPSILFIEDQERIDVIYTQMTSILDGTPTHTHSDQIRFIMDVPFPESIICALAVVKDVSILEAEEKFLRGTVIDASEWDHFDRRIKKQLKKSGKPLESHLQESCC
ncbi:PWWP domain-containing DNA repair factor 3A-like isoform X1 [Carassius gibelio]|uniref:PWWP domain-containing DNA repair factor 3A-like isoform X1 n=1 Tax=Carassius gibelio TaxID=101364 RepID=UPI002277CD39|nr:PWWP domain-containing DNA repair factor 3A-like isoform X1 [Carassius gibelio]